MCHRKKSSVKERLLSEFSGVIYGQQIEKNGDSIHFERKKIQIFLNLFQGKHSRPFSEEASY